MTPFADGKDSYLSENFHDLKYQQGDIRSVTFEECTFIECDFSESTFDECQFVDCQFIKCNLSLVNLKQSRFTDVGFEDCKVIGVDWTKAAWPNIALFSPVKFTKSTLNDCTFFGLSLKEVVIEECQVREVDFREGDFSESNFTYTDFSNSLFNNTNLAGVDFSEAINYTIDIFQNEIKGAKFSRTEAISLLDSLDIELID